MNRDIAKIRLAIYETMGLMKMLRQVIRERCSSTCIEEGDVLWMRDLERAMEESRNTGRPVFILFQEIPGCSTCISFAENVLKDRKIIDLIEKRFVACIVNNRGITLADHKALVQFNEPRCNNPVIRIVDANGTELLTRISGNYSSSSILRILQEFLCKTVVPRIEEIFFEMECYWEGQGCLDFVCSQFEKEAVLSTTAVLMNHMEMVRVQFDPLKLDMKQFLKEIDKYKIITRVLFTDPTIQQIIAKVWKRESTLQTSFKGKWHPARHSDQRYFIKQSASSSAPLFDRQSMALNGKLWASTRGYLPPHLS